MHAYRYVFKRNKHIDKGNDCLLTEWIISVNMEKNKYY